MLRNQSGYPDPTAERAMGHIEIERRRDSRRPMVYICAPYRGDPEANIEKAKEYCKYAIDQHMTPIATHLLYPPVLGMTETPEIRKIVMYMGKTIIRHCRELWWFGEEPTEGMKEEIEYADRQGLVVKHFV